MSALIQKTSKPTRILFCQFCFWWFTILLLWPSILITE